MEATQEALAATVHEVPWQEIGKSLARHDARFDFLNVLQTALLAVAIALMFVRIPHQEAASAGLMIAALCLASIVVAVMEIKSFTRDVRALLSGDTLWQLPSGAPARFSKVDSRGIRFAVGLDVVSISYRVVREMVAKSLYDHQT
jgi:hypothetical protein